MVSALCTDVMRAYWTSNTNCIVCATWNAESNTKFLTASKRAFPYSLKPRSEIFLIPAFAKRVIPYFCPCFCLLEPSVEAGYSFSLSSCMWCIERRAKLKGGMVLPSVSIEKDVFCPHTSYHIHPSNQENATQVLIAHIWLTCC